MALSDHNILVGTLDERVTIEQATSAANATGELVKTWSTLTTTWAKIEWSGGNELDENNRLTVVQNHAFIIRFRANVTPSMRLLWRGNRYNIRNIIQLGRRQYLKLITENFDDGATG